MFAVLPCKTEREWDRDFEAAFRSLQDFALGQQRRIAENKVGPAGPCKFPCRFCCQSLQVLWSDHIYIVHAVFVDLSRAQGILVCDTQDCWGSWI